ncbi:MAG: twin-arginine translocase subunit TatB [Gammaproteobacteria bacterium]|nr:twin-arginine translocase subunit TatB [Gammaproteobacteria bacterium]
MFDIGFWELMVIAVVALLVIGPERLPEVARSTGRWYGKVRGFVNNMKREINRELKADELKQMLTRQVESDGIHEILEEGRQFLNSDLSVTDKPAAAASEAQQRVIAAPHENLAAVSTETDLPASQADAAAAKSETTAVPREPSL